MQTIRWIPPAGQDSIVLDLPGYLVQDVDGLGGAPASIQTVRSPHQHGAIMVEALAEPRDLSLRVRIFGDTPQQVWTRRRELVSKFNLLQGMGRLRVTMEDGTNYEINAIADGTPEFREVANQSPFTQVALINLIAPNPFWFTPDSQLTTLSPGNNTTLTNSGDVEAPVQLIFHGPLDEPSLRRETPGPADDARLSIRHNIGFDERVEVDTGPGVPSIVKVDPEGNRTDGMQFLSPRSTFWHLLTGNNPVSFTANSGSGQVEIRHRNWFMGI